MDLTQKLTTFYRTINLLSIDVAAGAVCSSLLFAKILEVHILSYGLASLGLSVWIIYTTDHLLDARKIKTPAATERHRFHQRHFNLLLIFLGVAIIANGLIILFVRKPVLISGIIVASFVAIYLVLHRYLKFMKEFFIALFYTIGVLLPSVSVTPLAWNEWPWILIIQFFFTALINLILFSWFDFAKDLRDETVSFVTVVGERAGRIFLGIIFCIAFILAIGFSSGSSQVVIFIMNAILLIVFIFPQYFAITDRFRLIGDSVFFIPLLYFLI
jgi:hypothetical protein